MTFWPVPAGFILPFQPTPRLGAVLCQSFALQAIPKCPFSNIVILKRTGCLPETA
jgi:hypothetical protein